MPVIKYAAVELHACWLQHGRCTWCNTPHTLPAQQRVGLCATLQLVVQCIDVCTKVQGCQGTMQRPVSNIETLSPAETIQRHTFVVDVMHVHHTGPGQVAQMH